MRTEIDLSDPGDEPRTFTIRLRKRTDGRASVWFGRLRLSKEERRARAKTGSPYVEVSLRTTDETVAIKNAMEWRRAWNSSGLPKRNQLAGIPSFQTAADRWLEFEQQRALKAKKSGERARSDDQLRRWECSVRRYLVPVFGTLPVNAITRADGERWHSWRTRYYVDGPGADEVTNEIVYERNGKTIRRPAQPRFADIPASTIGKDADAFAKILAFSRSEYHHLVWNEPISLRRMGPAAETESRDPFSPKERMHIFENASSRAHGFDFEDWEDPQFNREMLYNLVRFLWCTGLRVAEVKRLKVKHVVLNPTKRGKVIYAPKADVTTLGYLLEDVNEATRKFAAPRTSSTISPYIRGRTEITAASSPRHT